MTHMLLKDLFGNPVVEADLPSRHDKPKRTEEPKGYAAPPGTGPKGETCGSCQYAVKRYGGNKYYWKCFLRWHQWSSCYATDIRLKWLACRHWELAKLSPFKTTTA